MKKTKKRDSTENVVNFLFEAGILAKTPRSGFHFLGTGDQSVAEHVSRVVFDWLHSSLAPEGRGHAQGSKNVSSP